METKDQYFFMGKALQQAGLALKHEEVPIGAVVVDANNNIIARAYNKVEKLQSQLAHAEMIAIKKAAKKVSNWRLNGCRIYVTLEPCLMCFGLIQLSRLDSIVFGAKSTLFGAGLSDVEKLPPYSKNLEITGRVREQESLDILKTFFSLARNKRKDDSEAKTRLFK